MLADATDLQPPNKSHCSELAVHCRGFITRAKRLKFHCLSAPSTLGTLRDVGSSSCREPSPHSPQGRTAESVCPQLPWSPPLSTKFCSLLCLTSQLPSPLKGLHHQTAETQTRSGPQDSNWKKNVIKYQGACKIMKDTEKASWALLIVDVSHSVRRGERIEGRTQALKWDKGKALAWCYLSCGTTFPMKQKQHLKWPTSHILKKGE